MRANAVIGPPWTPISTAMKGRASSCPDEILVARFQDLEARASDEDDARFRACVDALASGLRIAPSWGPQLGASS